MWTSQRQTCRSPKTVENKRMKYKRAPQKNDADEHPKTTPNLLPGSWSLLPKELSYSVKPLDRTLPELYRVGDVVWVKIPRYPWWPAEVIEDDDIPALMYENKRAPVVVQFINETHYERITNPKLIKEYDCPEKEHFITEGMKHQCFMYAVSCAGKKYKDLHPSPVQTPSKCRTPQSNASSPEKYCKQQDLKSSMSYRNGVCVTESQQGPSVEWNSYTSHGPQLCSNSRVDDPISETMQNQSASLCSEETGKSLCERPKLCVQNNSLATPLCKKTLYSDLDGSYNAEELSGNSGASKVTVNWTKKRKGSLSEATNCSQKKMKRHASDSYLEGDNSVCEGVDPITEINKTFTLLTSSVSSLTDDKYTSQKCTESEMGNISPDLPDLKSSISNRNRRTHGKRTKKIRGVRGKKKQINGKQNPERKKFASKTDSRKLASYPQENQEVDYETISDDLQKISYVPKHVCRTKTKPIRTRKPKKKMLATKSKKVKKSGRDSQTFEDTDSQDSGISNLGKYRESSSPVPLTLCDIDHNFTSSTDDILDDENNKPTAVHDSESKTSTLYDPNLHKDLCDSSDSDEELPEGLTPIAQEPLAEDDIVWVKQFGCIHWPAVVKRIYRKRKRILKVTVLPIERISYFPSKFTVVYHPKRIMPFLHADKEKFMEKGEQHENKEIRDKFLHACETVVNYFSKKALGNLQPEDTEFFKSIESCETSEEETTAAAFPLVEESLQIVADEESVKDDEEEDDTDDVQFVRQEKENKKITERYNKIKLKNEKLVEFCLSPETKKYLLEIISEKRSSDRHKDYFYGTPREKNKLKNSGFGPIADDDQQEKMVQQMLEWYREAKELGAQDIPDVGYVLDVWVPEAVVLGLIKVKRYARSKAIIMFEKGVTMTKIEKQSLHLAMLESVKKVSEEDRLYYKEKGEERLKAFFYQNNIDYNPDIFSNN